MKKIISLFQRNYDTDHLVRNEIVPGAEWVIAGEGVATRKYDGTCCKIENGVFYKRYTCKKGKAPPRSFMPSQDPDPITGHWPGWVPVSYGSEDKYYWEAYKISGGDKLSGTFEMCGPKVGGNPELFDNHVLIQHGIIKYSNYDCPRTFNELRDWFTKHPVEGIVWHHPDGRMVKIKRKDFGLTWPIK